MERSIPTESLCRKCRRLLWDASPHHYSPRPCQAVDHHKSLGQLRNSAKTGCRTCQIFWLYTIAETKAKVDDDFELKFTWTREYPVAQIIIEDSSQSFTYGVRERMTENISMERAQFAMGNQTRRDFGGIQFSEGQVSMPSPKITAGEGSTINQTFVARISVYLGHGVKINPIAYDDSDLEYTMQGIVKPWVDDCVKNHHGCQEMQQLGFESRAPTRLIDVGTVDEGTVKLVDTGELSKPQYLILSYCWGTSNDKSKTTQANLEQRRVSIQISTLPKTIRDAITITRLMGVQYLWVDAICIIQQDKENNDGFLEDWKIEAAKMAGYYSNALCCISNLSATDSSEGFLRETQAGFQQRGRQRTFREDIEKGAEHFCHGDKKFTIYLPRSIESWRTEWESSPLMRRAWALQEWILSPRILHCTTVGMFMECGRGVCQPNDPFTKPMAAWHHTQGNEISNILSESAKAQVGDLWTKLVTFYSTMNLTDPTDRLVAIDGIARLFCAKYNIGYFAGVLSSHIAQTLLWKRNEPEEERNPAVIFPSWSWSSTKNVQFPFFETCICYITCIDDSCFLLSDKAVNYFDPSTRLFPLRGPILPFSAVSHPSLLDFHGDHCSSYCNSPLWGGKHIHFYIDSMKEFIELKQCVTDQEKAGIVKGWKLLVCLRSFIELSDGHVQSSLSGGHILSSLSDGHVLSSHYGLIVEKLEDTTVNAYRRIGLFQVNLGTKKAVYIFQSWDVDINLF